jgi:four helix bundle protein
MATYESFEELQAWQKSRELVNEIYSVSKHGMFAQDFPLRDQIRKAGVSIISNIAEGFDRGGTAEFV